jgi:hypothetical protein
MVPQCRGMSCGMSLTMRLRKGRLTVKIWGKPPQFPEAKEAVLWLLLLLCGFQFCCRR